MSPTTNKASRNTREIWRFFNLGNVGERLAANYLQSRNYFVWQRNWRCKLGEIDIIAIDGDTLVIVEVKTRDKLTYESFSPSKAVNREKQAKLGDLATEFQKKFAKEIQHRRLRHLRFDLTAVKRTNGIFFEEYEITHTKGAW